VTHHRRGVGFWLTAAIGWALIGWGVRGAVHHHIDTRPEELARFFVGGLLAHDLVFAPLVLGTGVAVSRLTPGRWRAGVQAALILAGLVVLFAYPEIRDYARTLHNPTSLPHNYTSNAAIVAAVAVAGVAVVSVIRAGVARRRAG
jgi:drug/metabolite transporter (DMT)-like permease